MISHLSVRACALSLTLILVQAFPLDAWAKLPGATHCYNGICHRVRTLAETHKQIGRTESVQASHYDHCKRDRFNPCTLTSSGEEFRPERPDNAASPVLPDGTRLLVWHPGTKRAVIVRINNAGPYFGRRMLDLSRAAAERLGFAHSGVASVRTKVLSAPTQAETTYVRRRRYKPVPGYIGRFASLEAAYLAVAQQHAGFAVSPVYAVADRQPPRRRTTVAAALPSLVDETWQFSAQDEPEWRARGDATGTAGDATVGPTREDVPLASAKPPAVAAFPVAGALPVVTALTAPKVADDPQALRRQERGLAALSARLPRIALRRLPPVELLGRRVPPADRAPRAASRGAPVRSSPVAPAQPLARKTSLREPTAARGTRS